MVRLVGIALIIWGLIAQPLIAQPLTADMPVPMTENMHHSAVDEQSSNVGCHDEAAEPESSEHCDKCDNDCMNGMCASSCVTSGAAAPQKSVGFIDIPGSIAISSSSRARSYGLPSQIFHPPKHG